MSGVVRIHEDVGEQQLRVEARAFDAVFLEITGGRGNDFLNVLQGMDD